MMTPRSHFTHAGGRFIATSIITSTYAISACPTMKAGSVWLPGPLLPQRLTHFLGDYGLGSSLVDIKHPPPHRHLDIPLSFRLC